jgi:predicted nuclease of restriction endonuclease-like (RecB) superfamily
MNINQSYQQFLKELKQSITQSRYVAARFANREQIELYIRTGCRLSQKIALEKWGSKVIDQLAADLQKELPGLRGFSYRNLMKMKQFAEEYKSFEFLPLPTAETGTVDATEILPLATAELDLNILSKYFFDISFTHHILLLNKCKNIEERFFYIAQAATQYWSVSMLDHKINEGLFRHQGRLPNNFGNTVSKELKETTLQVFQDEYLWDFMSLDGEENERGIENEIVSNIRKFILDLGKGFSFIGNQYRLEVDGQEFFIDLLFFNRHLQALVIFELKRGAFKPEYAGQLNFYLNVLDDKVKLPHENPSIGIIICKEKSNTVVEYAFKSIDNAMGAATFKTVRSVPNEMKGILPDADKLSELLE